MCGATLSNFSIVAQLEHAIRVETAKYYEGWLVSDDAACGARTRQMSVYGSRCLGPRGLAQGCRGKMSYEYGEKAIWNQLLYFSSLWDVEKAKEKASGSDKGMFSRRVTFEVHITNLRQKPSALWLSIIELGLRR